MELVSVAPDGCINGTQCVQAQDPVVVGVVQDVECGGDDGCLVGWVAKLNWHAYQFSHNSRDFSSHSSNLVGVCLPIGVQLGEGVYYTLVDYVHHAAGVHIGPMGDGHVSWFHICSHVEEGGENVVWWGGMVVCHCCIQDSCFNGIGCGYCCWLQVAFSQSGNYGVNEMGGQ
jgi:hypothetical protein